MKNALILYWHGLGDVIMLTPVLRYLHQHGYSVDLMCRPEVRSSNVLGNCPYVNCLIDIPNPWRSNLGFDNQKNINIDKFKQSSKNYHLSACCLHENIIQGCKISTNWNECDLVSDNNELEIFIPTEVEQRTMKHIREYYPDGYVYRHTQIEFHGTHNWDCADWIANNFPNLYVVDTGIGGHYHRVDSDINFSFVLAREATHRVLSSSVFVHACDAMGVTIDAINYGKPDRKVWPKGQSRVLRIRENGVWIK